jgi:hypothetical protein
MLTLWPGVQQGVLGGFGGLGGGVGVVQQVGGAGQPVVQPAA